MNKTTLKIKGMSCAHCVKKIETALLDLNGVVVAKVNLKKEIAKVKYDGSALTLEDLTATVKEAGYEAAPNK
ncbi:copper ion binding protein [Lederbergia galactosidilytica]|uniref:Copper chaperone CopZ n=1 Tax=Lederbergia galactosidilytica TaxID=217031 RepID=A0A0Q9XWM5_9BACI|nr:copper ion binding protein [Lederbergia galactosidilytica]KRG12918.1 COP associated protein [Lederbergia galactosidilytica]MBP1916335.1 copper ion binding protein [Lederbergia galactosidilytica]OAK70658.1 COP associated protein [Lederbergia galactosidilytica]